MSIGATEQAVHIWSRLKIRLFTLLLSRQFREFGAGSRLAPPFRFHGLHQIRVGQGVIIERNCWIHVVDGYAEADTVKLVIGSRAGIGMDATISAAQQVTIGESVLLARNVYISDHAHAFEDITVPIRDQGIDKIKPVSIGRSTWLGQNVCVLPGASVGEHCVIGANSVVIGHIPDFSVAVGAPARVVRRYNPGAGSWESQVREASKSFRAAV